MDTASLFALALSCTTLSPPAHIAAVAAIASAGDIHRVQVNGRPASYSTATEALDLANAKMAAGHHVMVGLGLLTPQELEAAGMDIGDGLSACRALTGLDFILADVANNLHIADEDERWTTAAAIRASGSADATAIAGFTAQIEEIVAALPDKKGLAQRPGKVAAPDVTASRAAIPVEASDSVELNAVDQSPTLDVFQSQRSSQLLIYSKDK